MYVNSSLSNSIIAIFGWLVNIIHERPWVMPRLYDLFVRVGIQFKSVGLQRVSDRSTLCFFVQRWAWSDPALPPAICEPLKESPFSPQVCPLFHDSRIRFRLRVIVPAAV